MTGSYDGSHDCAVAMSAAAAFRYLYTHWTTADRGWKATITGLIILMVIVQS
jgi:hypothetical protein